MRFSAVALAGFAAVAYAAPQDAKPDATVPAGDASPDDVEVTQLSIDGVTEPLAVDPATLYTGQMTFPVGVQKPTNEFMPTTPPPADSVDDLELSKGGKPPLWHPSHKGIFIDDCDDDKNDHWHWAKKPKNHPKPVVPHHVWTTSTVTKTATKTVFKCPPKVPCPEKPKTKFTTTTVLVTTTVCPVTIPNKPTPPPKPTKPVAPPPPTPPKTSTKPAPPGPPAATAPPTAPEVPKVSKPPVVVAAGAAQNAAGALAAVAAFVAALV